MTASLGPELDIFRQQWHRELGVSSQEGLRRAHEASTATTAPMSAMNWEPSETASSQDFSATPGPSRSPFFVDSEMDSEPAAVENAASMQTVFTIATDFGTTFTSVVFSKREQGRQGPLQAIDNFPEDAMPSGKLSREVPTEIWYPIPTRARDEPTIGADHVPDDDQACDIFADDETVGDADLEDDDFSDTQNGSQEYMESVAVENHVDPVLWGFEIQNKMLLPAADHNRFIRVARFKLLLDTSRETQHFRDELKPDIKRLKGLKLIRDDEDLISDYLKVLFLHTKSRLTETHGLDSSCIIEHVLCVPIAWSSKACRIMQKCMGTAIHASKFGSLDNLFIVSEPEAAAASVLEDNDNINPGETFVIIDAGGGTVDAATYTVHQQYPLRLNQEAVEPKGCSFGSSILNDSFSKYMRKRLKAEKYLEVRGYTIDGIVDALKIRFENEIKRRLDVTRPVSTGSIAVQGLRQNSQKRFLENSVEMRHKDWINIYKPVLSKISKLMIQQLDDAKIAGFQVQKVVLVGGFAGSPSLIGYLRKKLRDFSQELEYPVRLMDFDSQETHFITRETAVAHGAVLRALNKKDGPIRNTLSSYGFQIHENYDKEGCEAHKDARPTIDKLDGLRWVRNTICWLVKRGEVLPPHKEYSIEVEHTFTSTKTHLLCEDILYVSDTSTESHYRVSHPMNKGAEIAGIITANMTFLKTDGKISLEIPDKTKGEKGKPHYRIRYQLVMIIDGRNLRYEARYPAGGEVQDQGQISIAAAFVPGTN